MARNARTKGSVNMQRLLFMACALFVLPPSFPLWAQQEAYQADLAVWLEDLDHTTFARREEATRRLIETRRFGIESLEAAAASGSAEKRWRVVHVLRKLCLVRDRETSRPALAALRRLASSSNAGVSERAQSAVDDFQSKQHARASAEIIALGGTVKGRLDFATAVRLDDKWRGGDQSLALLADLRHVSSLSISGSDVSDEGLRHIQGLADLQTLFIGKSRVRGPGIVYLKSLHHLTYLSLNNSPIQDQHIAHLSGLTQLQYLGLDETLVGDGALKKLAGLTDLRILWLNGSRVSDAGLAHLKPFKRLSRIDLSRTLIKGPGLAHLQKLTGLNFISLQYVQIGDDALKPLGKLTNLESLGLDDTLVTDAGLAHLAPLKKLESLWMTNTKLTDAGLKKLQSFPNLKKLAIKGTQVTQQGVDAFKAALPNCRLTHDLDLASRTDNNHPPTK